MKITCIHCGHTCQSFIINREEALAEISKDFAAHLEKHPTSHQEWMNDVNSINMIVVWLLMISKHTTLLSLPLEKTIDDPVKKQFDMVMEKVEEILGIEDVEVDNINPTKAYVREKKIIQMNKNNPITEENKPKPEEVEFPSIGLPPSA